jgi:hypothetical protein
MRTVETIKMKEAPMIPETSPPNGKIVLNPTPITETIT